MVQRRGLDALVFGKPGQRSGDLYPTAVHAGDRAIELVERILAVLLEPEMARTRVDSHPEAVADAVDEERSRRIASRSVKRLDCFSVYDLGLF